MASLDPFKCAFCFSHLSQFHVDGTRVLFYLKVIIMNHYNQNIKECIEEDTQLVTSGKNLIIK